MDDVDFIPTEELKRFDYEERLIENPEYYEVKLLTEEPLFFNKAYLKSITASRANAYISVSKFPLKKDDKLVMFYTGPFAVYHGEDEMTVIRFVEVDDSSYLCEARHEVQDARHWCLLLTRQKDN